MPATNPAILLWARQTAGLSLEVAASKLGIGPTKKSSPVERLQLLESGGAEPSRVQLRNMAKQYRRPLVVFYLANPPMKGERGEDFRTVPANASEKDEATLDTLLRTIRARQSLLRAALEDEDEATILPFVGSLKQSQGVAAGALALEKAIAFTSAEYREGADADDAFSMLRTAAERVGVYVLLAGDVGSHHSAIEVETFRGFALADPVAPFVVINDNDSRAAWSFTLLHEMTHILLGATGVSGGHGAKAIERFCNDVASRFLLPDVELGEVKWRVDSQEHLVQQIGQFARARRISRGMVAYRLLRSKVIEEAEWNGLKSRFHQEWVSERDRNKAKDGKRNGADWYVVRRHRLGKSLIETTARMMASGALTTSKAGRVLGLRPTQVAPLLAPPAKRTRAKGEGSQ